MKETYKPLFFYEFIFWVIKIERLSSDMSTGNPALDQHKVMNCLAGLLHRLKLINQHNDILKALNKDNFILFPRIDSRLIVI